MGEPPGYSLAGGLILTQTIHRRKEYFSILCPNPGVSCDEEIVATLTPVYILSCTLGFFSSTVAHYVWQAGDTAGGTT